MTYQQIRTQLTMAEGAYKRLSGADARKAAALAEVQRLSDLLKQTLAAVPQWRRGGGNYRPY